MITQIDHIGIAVKDLGKQIKIYSEMLGITPGKTEIIEEQKVTVAMFSVGEIRIELLQATSDDSPVAKFIEKRGEGIHHIAYRVDDIDDRLRILKENNIVLIDEQPKIGAEGSLIAFIHPKSTAGVLTELCQMNDKGV